MQNRAREIAQFLARAGWDKADRRVLAGDASPRRYDRLTRSAPPFSAVLMDAPPEKDEDIRPFLTVGAFLSRHGLGAPEIFAHDAALGLILLEDLGDDLFARVCARTPADEPILYQSAVDVLLTLHSIAEKPDLPAYDHAVLLREARLLTDWYLPAATGKQVTLSLHQEFSDLVTAACGDVAKARNAVVLRDYHAENLLWLPPRPGVKNVGLLDFQDALLGHPAYDLVSLLEDARRDTPKDLQSAMLGRYIDAAGCDPETFKRAYAVLGAQRNLKIIGIFCRLALRDGKAGYLDLIPRVWAHLRHDLEHPALNELGKWVDANVPAPDDTVLASIRRGLK